MIGNFIEGGLGALGSGLTAVRASLSAAARDLVSSRPDDSLAERDPAYIRATLPAYRRLTQIYFRAKVTGLERIPSEGPVLLVGNHSGGTMIADTFAFAYAFYDHFGPERAFYQLAHALAVALPGLSALLRPYGTVEANHDNAARAFDAGAAVLVYPGGDYETYRPSWHSSEVEFGGRSGFIRLALSQGVPIVPVVALGGQETALFLTRGERAARALKLDRIRIKVLPVQLGPPWGLTVLDLPGRIPLPSQLTIQVLPPIDLRERFGPAPDEQNVYDAITRDMQHVLDELAEDRDLPVVGSVGARQAGGASVEELPGDEPWPGYDGMRVPEIAKRLRRENAATAAAVRTYEQGHKRRKGVLEAAVRARTRRPKR